MSSSVTGVLLGVRIAALQHASSPPGLQCVFSSGPAGRRPARVALGSASGQYGGSQRLPGTGRGEMRRLASIIWSAGEKFAADDGWAIASYISLSLLTSLFPFLIFVGALAGFLGSAELAEGAARLGFAEWPGVVAPPIARQVSRGLTYPRGRFLSLGAGRSFCF